MMHKPSVGSFTLVGQISIVLLLVVPLTIQATQFANRIHNDVIEDHIFEGLDDLDYIPQWLPTSSNHLGSDPLGSASNHWSSGFPWGTMNDIPPLGAQKPPRPEATNLKEKTISSDLPTPIPNTPPVDHHEGAVDGREHRLAQILNSDFERADILKAAEPHHTHVHSGLDDSFYWEHQPSPAEPGQTFLTSHASESLRNDQDAVIRQNLQGDTRRLVTSEIPAPPRPRDENFAGGYDSSERLHRDASPNSEVLSEPISISNSLDAHRETKRRKLTSFPMLTSLPNKNVGVVFRPVWVQHQIDVVLKAAADALGNLHETMKYYYKNELAHLISPPFQLLDDGNFEGKGAHNFLIESSVTDKNKLEQSLAPLWKYLSAYESYYKPAKGKQLTTGQQKLPTQVTNQIQTERRKSNLHAIYLAANGRFSGTGLGRTLDTCRKLWLVNLVACHDSHDVSNPSILKSWYDSITFTTTTVLYHIELMYRLSIPMDETLKEKKDESLSEALRSLNDWWLKFPFFDDMPVTLLESNDFYSKSSVKKIKSLRRMHGGNLKFLEMSTVFLSNWFKTKHPVTFEKIKKNKSNEVLMSQVFGVLQDCTWIDYISMPIESSMKATLK